MGDTSPNHNVIPHNYLSPTFYHISTLDFLGEATCWPSAEVAMLAPEGKGHILLGLSV